MLFDDVRKKIVARESFGAWENYADNYQEHVAFREERIPAYVAEEFGDPRLMRSNTLVLRQALVFRAIDLFEGALLAAASNKFFPMVLSIRGHFETTASVGYLHSRLNSLNRGTIDALRFEQDVSAQILGSRDEILSEAPQAKQVLSMLEYADKSINTHVLGELTGKHNMLSDPYSWLSEFCHPNFHSNLVSFDLDKTVPEFRFRHGANMRDQECQILEYILISGPIFVALFEQTGDLITQVFDKI